MSIDMGIGVSSEADVYAAGQQAARQVVAHLGGARPDLTLVFASLRFADPRMLRGVRSITDNARLIGCTDAGGIGTPGSFRRSVTVIGLKGKNGARFVVSLGRDLSKALEATTDEVCAVFQASDRQEAKALLVFPDGLTVSGSDLLRRLQSRLGRVPIVGGSAADDFLFQRTFQFFDEQILTDSIPAALLCGDIAVGVGVYHGWVPLGRPRRVTKAIGNTVYQLDQRPAISIYEDYLGGRREEWTEDPLAQMAMTYPLGVLIPGETEYLLRDALRLGPDGALICTADLPEGSEVRLMIGEQESALEAARHAARQAIEHLGEVHLKGALVFCSVARQKVLGGEYHGEVDVIRDALGGSGVRLGGFYTYGEHAPVSGENRFHNESVVVMAMG